MDFVSNALFNGRRFRALTLVDHYTHECLDIVVDQSLCGEHMAEAMITTGSGATSTCCHQGRQWQRVRREGHGSLGV